MKIYSEITGKEYKTVEECQHDEEQVAVQKAAEAAKADKLKKERKQRAEEVNEAYKNYMKLLNNFVKDYGSYHLSLRGDDGLFTDFFKYAFTW
jgi:uncharacterized FlaG/YvyC family protein